MTRITFKKAAIYKFQRRTAWRDTAINCRHFGYQRTPTESSARGMLGLRLRRYDIKSRNGRCNGFGCLARGELEHGRQSASARTRRRTIKSPLKINIEDLFKAAESRRHRFDPLPSDKHSTCSLEMSSYKSTTMSIYDTTTTTQMVYQFK